MAVRVLVSCLCLSLVSCGASAAEFNAAGERHVAAWEKTEDNAEFVMALRAFNEAAHLEPANAVYQFNLGTTLAMARCYELALPHLQNAARLNHEKAKQNLLFVEEALAAKESKCESNSSLYLPSP